MLFRSLRCRTQDRGCLWRRGESGFCIRRIETVRSVTGSPSTISAKGVKKSSQQCHETFREGVEVRCGEHNWLAAPYAERKLERPSGAAVNVASYQCLGGECGRIMCFMFLAPTEEKRPHHVLWSDWVRSLETRNGSCEMPSALKIVMSLLCTGMPGLFGLKWILSLLQHYRSESHAFSRAAVFVKRRLGDEK